MKFKKTETCGKGKKSVAINLPKNIYVGLNKIVVVLNVWHWSKVLATTMNFSQCSRNWTGKYG